MAAELMFGPLDLLGYDSDFQVVALSTDEGTSWGNPDTVDVELRSFIQYGTLVETENWTNRPLVVAISVGGATSDDIARNEKTLVAQLHRRTTLAYTPETATCATVFPVLTSTLVPTHDDFLESFEREVIYQIKMTCAPFVRASDLVHVDAVSPVGDPENLPLETVGDATVWTCGITYEDVAYTPTHSVTHTADGVKLDSTENSLYGTRVTIDYSFQFDVAATDVSDHPYLYIDWQCSNPSVIDRFAVTAHQTGTGAPLPLTRVGDTGHDQMARTYFKVGDAITSISGTVTILFQVLIPAHEPLVSVTVGEVGTSNALPSATGRQLLRALELDGVMPATGSIAVVSPDATPLGEVLVYTCPRLGNELYLPPCRSYLVEPAVTDSETDMATASGERLDITAAYRQVAIPQTHLPDGEYLLGARVNMAGKDAAGKSIEVLAAAYMGGVLVQPEENLGKVDTSVLYDDPTGGYQYIPLLTLSLPRIAMARVVDAVTSIRVGAADGTGTAWLDDLYLWNLTLGELTHVRCGPTATRLWIDSPDASNDGQPGIWIGTQPDRTNQVSAFPNAAAFDIHRFDPVKGVNITTVVTGPVDAAEVSFDYYPQSWYRVAPRDVTLVGPVDVGGA